MHRDSVSRWRLHVAEGPNAGAELALHPGTYSLGCGVHNDIVLSDTGVAGQHISFEIGALGATLVAHADGAALQGRALLQGRTQALAAGSELRLGATVLRVSGPAPAGFARPGKMLCVGLAIFGLSSGLLTYGMATSMPHPRHARSEAVSRGADIGTARRDLAAYLQAGFGSSLQVGTAGGALVVTGALLPSDQPAWREAQAWFDKRFGGRLSLVSRVDTAIADALPRLDIAAVSLSPVPSVITRDGERYTAGAVLAGGWTIGSIAADGIVLQRQGRDVRITL